MKIPVTLLTGFLGSGKTTLLNALLRDPAMAGSAVLINEVGEIGIDHHLVEKLDEEIVLLQSGCVCCSIRGDLSRSLRNLFMRRLRKELPALDRVVIETTGLADPAPVIHTLINDFFVAERFCLDGVIVTVDVGHMHEHIEAYDEALKQIAMADRLIFTKCDLATEATIVAAEATAAALNPTAERLRAAGDTLSAVVLGGMGLYDPAGKPADVARWLNEAAARDQEQLVRRAGVFGAFGANASPLVHDQRISTHVLRFSEPFEWVDFSEALDLLQSAVGKQLLRIKGLVAVKGENAPRVIHAVQHERYPATSLSAWPDEDHDSRLVFIVRDLPRSIPEHAFATICNLHTVSPKKRCDLAS